MSRQEVVDGAVHGSCDFRPDFHHFHGRPRLHGALGGANRHNEGTVSFVPSVVLQNEMIFKDSKNFFAVMVIV